MSFRGRMARLRRLLTQSRIRLPRSPIHADELKPGDWVQLGDTTWRVATRRWERGRAVFRLRPFHGADGAVLSAPRTDGDWVLETRGEEVLVPPELLVVFSVV